MAKARQGTSPWVWIGCGCLGLVLLAVGGMVAIGYFGSTMFRDYTRQLADPGSRREQVGKILGADELPAGWNAQFFFRVPLLMDLALVSDGEPAEYDAEAKHQEITSEQMGENAFLYLRMRAIGDARQDFERLLEGKDAEHVRLDVDFRFRSREIVGRGELDLPPAHVRWVAHRGEFSDRRGRVNGTYAVMLVECPDSERVRAGFYWQRRELPEAVEGEPLDLAGTPGDEATLRAFLEHFHLCGQAAEPSANPAG